MFPVRKQARAGELARGELRVVTRSGLIDAPRVVEHHAARIEPRNHGGHRTLAAPDPVRRIVRDAFGAPTVFATPAVIERQHFLLDRVEDELRLESIPTCRILHRYRLDTPAVVSGAGFGPPAVEHAQVQTAVR